MTPIFKNGAAGFLNMRGNDQPENCLGAHFISAFDGVFRANLSDRDPQMAFLTNQIGETEPLGR